VPAGPTSDSFQQVTLPDSALSCHEQVVPPADKVARREFLNLQTVDGLGIELPVEVFQGVHRREAGLTDPPFERSLASGFRRLAQDAFQELEVGPGPVFRLVQRLVEVRLSQDDPQRLQVLQDSRSPVRAGWGRILAAGTTF